MLNYSFSVFYNRFKCFTFLIWFLCLVFTQMSNNDSLDVLNLPPRIYNPGFEPNIGAVVIQHFETHLVKKVELALGEEQFNLIKASFLGPIIELAKRSGVNFSGKIFHFLMQRRLLLKEKNLWFTFDSQPMRFSEREFLLTTGVQCDLIDSEMLRKGKAPSKAPYFWTQKEHFTLEQLQKRLFEPNQLHPLDAEEKLSLGMVILTEAFLFTPGSLEKIPLSRLVHASEFAIYTSQPWGKHAYRVLATSIQRINENTWARGTYEVKGFAMAILLWAFSAVPSLGSAFATECVTSRSEYPLCLKWETTQTPRFSHENKQTETREESCSPPDEDSHENVNDEKVAQEEGATDEVPHANEENDPQCSNVNDKVSQKKEKQHEEMRNMDGAPQGTQESDSQRSNVNDKVAQTKEAQHNKMGHSEEPSQESDSQQSKVNDKVCIS
ncbi:uncharacterized protein LOC9300102 [Arabidopsis lyrata subsp. lyrata]|uniref:uncharacterized protein LOC9300102 n=1 Tax=Arabidopsis lyrata subsp. lyrata TaxID=81972 RepID=UPI000A29D615|nr:uncharacterized protein LOC9300102 [Arabidopsis lyrata subsp. lyrata]|eukprot:XP_020871420.1 uncharacterized protein LOC9300102 [Arabidopsis lyrata subsp. lyrata]